LTDTPTPGTLPPAEGTLPPVAGTYAPGVTYEPAHYELHMPTGGAMVVLAFIAGGLITSWRLRARRFRRDWHRLWKGTSNR
jgi:hypothetical protein